MKILVTGGTGMIGTATIAALLRHGHEVRLLSRRANEDVDRFPDRVEPFAVDLAEPYELRTAVRGCACVVHIAGIVEERPPRITFERINVEGTREICDAAASVGRPYIVFVSSLGAVHGTSAYQQSKLRAEQHVRAYPGSWLILRCGNVYGPGDSTVSTLLKMVRRLPAVPLVGSGEQPFQPLWHTDAGEAIARSVNMFGLAGSTLELAGLETTTMRDLLDRLAQITGRRPPRVLMPVTVATLGVRACEIAEGFGGRLLNLAGFGAPIDTAKLEMLLDGSGVSRPEDNALVARFGVAPTPLQEGLRMLAGLVPEQLPGAGVGAVKQSTYTVAIVGARTSPEELIDLVCERMGEIVPLEMAAEPECVTAARNGETLTGALPGRGHFQIRMIERTPRRATWVTIEGHPLAGLLEFSTVATNYGVQFTIVLIAQCANALDWMVMRTVGSWMQDRNWRRVVERVVELSGGTTSGGVRREVDVLRGTEWHAARERAQSLVDAHRRAEFEKTVGGPVARSA